MSRRCYPRQFSCSIVEFMDAEFGGAQQAKYAALGEGYIRDPFDMCETADMMDSGPHGASVVPRRALRHHGRQPGDGARRGA